MRRNAIKHPGAKGGASESQWHKLLKTHLPKRYRVCKAAIIDSTGGESDEIDVAIFDNQYSLLLLELDDVTYIPARVFMWSLK